MLSQDSVLRYIWSNFIPITHFSPMNYPWQYVKESALALTPISVIAIKKQ